jgi:hypothetical protein
MAAIGSSVSGRIEPLQFSESLVVHVELGRLNLRRTQVAELVEGSMPNSAHSLAFDRVFIGLARNGRRIIPGCK